jgi:hypothetical protein
MPAHEAPMTPLEALQLLEQATAHVSGNREVHSRILDACRIVGAALMDAAAQKKIAAEAQDEG